MLVGIFATFQWIPTSRLRTYPFSFLIFQEGWFRSQPPPPPPPSGSAYTFQHAQNMLNWMDMKIITILCLKSMLIWTFDIVFFSVFWASLSGTWYMVSVDHKTGAAFSGSYSVYSILLSHDRVGRCNYSVWCHRLFGHLQ